jgi:hypothetical protein
VNATAGRRSPTAVAGVVVSVLLILSLSLPWGMVHVDFSNSLLAGLQDMFKDDVYSAWRMHRTWDKVIAGAAIVAIVASMMPLLGRNGHRAIYAAATTLAGAVSTFAVVLTMADPPVPPSVDFINSIGGPLLPTIDLHPRYGLFVSLGLAAALAVVGLAQLAGSRRARAGTAVAGTHTLD